MKVVKFKEIAQRLTGISCPVFGVSWTAPEAEVTIARRVITFLEDRRVLNAPGSLESPDHCVESMFEIREYLTKELQGLVAGEELEASLRAMRAACRKFLDRTREADRPIRRALHLNGWESWIFFSVLGEMRGVFGMHVAKLAAQYGLDVEDGLASVLPIIDVEPVSGEDRHRRRLRE